MSCEYDRSFAPYVVPSGIPLELDELPDLRWAAIMVRGQLRGLIGEQVVRFKERLPRPVRSGRLGRSLDALQERLVPEAEGRIPTGGDAEFAYRRFAGTNPLLISRVNSWTEIPEKLRLPDPLFSRILGAAQTFPSRIQQGDLFIVRYDALRVGSLKDLQPGKYLAPATILFCYAPEVDSPFPVVPVAIECPIDRPNGPTTVLTPLDAQRWQAAKRIADVADLNHSELCLHLARAHFMTTPFAIALFRRLPRTHALRLFLLPHLRYNLFVERMAWLQGVRHTSGILLRSLAGTAAWSHGVAQSVYHDLSFREQHFERDLMARGLHTHPLDYPYRDDGRLLWQAIHRFVEGFVQCTYSDDGALKSDRALQAYIAEVIDPAGGNVRGLLAGARLETCDELSEILTQILFVAGPLHSLAHYSSAAQLQYVDESPPHLTANPLALGAGCVGSNHGSSFSGTTAADPGVFGAMHQYSRVVSTNCRHEVLGDFSRYEFGKRIEYQALIECFQADLHSAEKTIGERNVGRFAPFIHFMPSRITNGITV